MVALTFGELLKKKISTFLRVVILISGRKKIDIICREIYIEYKIFMNLEKPISPLTFLNYDIVRYGMLRAVCIIMHHMILNDCK